MSGLHLHKSLISACLCNKVMPPVPGYIIFTSLPFYFLIVVTEECESLRPSIFRVFKKWKTCSGCRRSKVKPEFTLQWLLAKQDLLVCHPTLVYTDNDQARAASVAALTPRLINQPVTGADVLTLLLS